LNTFDKGLARWPFRKIAVIYIIVVILALAVCAAAVIGVYRDRLVFAWQYSRLSEAAEQGTPAEVQGKMDALAASPNVVDVLVLGDDNSVAASSKNSPFARGALDLHWAGSSRDFLVSDGDSDAVFQYVSGDAWMVSSIFGWDAGDARKAFQNERVFERGYNTKTLYLVSVIMEQASGQKIYVISEPAAAAGGTQTLKVTGAVAALLFMGYWVLLALWAWKSASQAGLSGLLWGIVVLLTNLAGVLVYQIYRHAGATCPVCGAAQNRANRYCSSCGQALGAACPHCGARLDVRDRYCPGCGAAVPSEEE
jgi:hypothetical protein